MVRIIVDNLDAYPDKDDVENTLSATDINCEAPLLSELQAYYNSKVVAAKGMPSRQQLFPSEFTHILENIFLVELRGHPDNGADSFFYRVLGSALSEFIGQELSQKSLAEYKCRSRRARNAMVYSYVVRHKIPARIMGYVKDEHSNKKLVESISFPLSNDGKNVNMIIGATQFIDS